MKTIEQLKAAATKEKADADAALVVAEKKRVDAEAGFITLVISGAGGLVSKCRIPIAAVAQRGLFRILIGSEVSAVVTDTMPKGMSVTPIFGKGVYPTVGGPTGLGSHEDWDEISKEADYINTPDGNFIPPGCTNGHTCYK